MSPADLGMGQAPLNAAPLAADADRVLADRRKTWQLEDLVTQLVLVAMCAMLGCERQSSELQ